MLSLKTINASALYSMKGLGDMQSGLSDSVEKLSSGLRVNHARDDAARLRIGLDLQRQVKTLDAAVKNTMNAISMAQTADGALAGISDALIRLKGLAVQGRDGALSTTQLKSIADEMEQIRREVNSIANRTTFNSRRLLTDEFGQWLTPSTDELADNNWDQAYSDQETVKVIITADTNDFLKLSSTSGLTSVKGYNGATADGAATNGSWTSGNASEIGFTSTWANAKLALRDLAASRQGGSGEVNIQIIDADYHAFTNNGITSYYSVVTDQVSWDSARSSALSTSFLGLAGYLANITSAEENSFLSEKTGAIGWIGGSDATLENRWIWVDGPEAGTQFWQGVANGSAVNGMYNAWTAGVQPNNSGGQDYLRFNDPAGKWNDWDGAAQASVPTYIVEYGGTGSASQIAGITLKVDFGLSSPSNSPTFQVGAFTKSTYTASAFRDARIATNNRDTSAGDTFQDLATRILDVVNTASSRTSSNFAKISNLVDDVVTEIAARRTALGSMQNRLLATIQNDNRQSEGLQRSKSMVMETDFAAETARLTRMQIGQQAATAALAQANAMPNVVLALLK